MYCVLPQGDNPRRSRWYPFPHPHFRHEKFHTSFCEVCFGGVAPTTKNMPKKRVQKKMLRRCLVGITLDQTTGLVSMIYIIQITWWVLKPQAVESLFLTALFGMGNGDFPAAKKTLIYSESNWNSHKSIVRRVACLDVRFFFRSEAFLSYSIGVCLGNKSRMMQ